MQLCERLGGMTWEEMMNRMSSKELSMWLAKERLKPLDDPYWRSAMQAHTTAAVQGNKCKVDDFLPIKRTAKKNQTGQQHSDILSAAMARQRH